MTVYYIRPSLENAIILDRLLFQTYVSSDDIHFRAPYNRNTTRFIDYTVLNDNLPIVINDRVLAILEDRDVSLENKMFAEALLSTRLDFDQAVGVGWLPFNE